MADPYTFTFDVDAFLSGQEVEKETPPEGVMKRPAKEAEAKSDTPTESLMTRLATALKGTFPDSPALGATPQGDNSSGRNKALTDWTVSTEAFIPKYRGDVPAAMALQSSPVTTTDMGPDMGTLAMQDAQEQSAIRSVTGITESLGRPAMPEGEADSGVILPSTDAVSDMYPTQGLMSPPVQDTVSEIDTTTAAAPVEDDNVATYSVVSGDTLSKIAKANNTTVAELTAANPDIKDINKIDVGQEIKLPTVTAEEAVTEEVAAVTTVDTAPVFSYQNKEGSSKGTAERAVYQYAFEQGIKGDELRAFMAQVAHESSEFGKIKEGGLSSKNIQSILDSTKEGKRLDPSGKVRLRFIEDGITSSSGAAAAQNSQYRDGIAPGNGDYASGDGSTFKGRGYIQLTGRSNYKAMGEAIGEDLVNNPDLMLDTDIAKKATVQWWKDNVQTKKPDYTDTTAITKIVNGGTNGLTDRKRLHTKYGVKPKGN